MALMGAAVIISFGMAWNDYAPVAGPLATAASAAPLAVADAGVGSQGREAFAALSAMQQRVLGLWMFGAGLMLCRLFGGWWLLRRRLASLAPLPRVCRQWAQQLARRLAVAWPLRFAQSSAALAPQVIGWLRPVVLLPAVALTRLPPAQLEALLIHEFAHVRRFDVLVNLLQSLVEALLFYHPAVWWVSRRMRVERELCCDEWVLAQRTDPLVYARALTEVASWPLADSGPVVAATAGKLRDRIVGLLAPRPVGQERCAL